jgi:hypothetical protein
MSKLEQAGYPYVEGLHGIPFAGLPVGEIGRIVSGSGRDITFLAEPGNIWVKDENAKAFRLSANLNNKGFLVLNLKTRISRRFSERVHPDFYAANFIGFALANFERLGQQVPAIEGVWIPGSVNYAQFQKAYAATRSTVLAAQATWTGRRAIQHGFTQVREASIQLKRNGLSQITAIFEKPKDS